MKSKTIGLFALLFFSHTTGFADDASSDVAAICLIDSEGVSKCLGVDGAADPSLSDAIDPWAFGSPYLYSPRYSWGTFSESNWPVPIGWESGLQNQYYYIGPDLKKDRSKSEEDENAKREFIRELENFLENAKTNL